MSDSKNLCSDESIRVTNNNDERDSKNLISDECCTESKVSEEKLMKYALAYNAYLVLFGVLDYNIHERMIDSGNVHHSDPNCPILKEELHTVAVGALDDMFQCHKCSQCGEFTPLTQPQCDTCLKE